MALFPCKTDGPPVVSLYQITMKNHHLIIAAIALSRFAFCAGDTERHGKRETSLAAFAKAINVAGDDSKLT